MYTALLKQLQDIVGTDLMHTGTSEEDRPVQVFQRSAAEIAAKQDLKGLISGLHQGEPVVEEPVESFFAPLTEAEDWPGEAPDAAALRKGTAKRFEELQQLVSTRLTDPKVFVVGAGSEKQVYVVGTTDDGDMLGIQTSTVET